jgi:hypothetical protein
VSRRSGITPIVAYPNPSDQCNSATDMILPCHVLEFPSVQEQTLIRTPSSPQLRHWTNFPICRADKSYIILPGLLRPRMNFKCSCTTTILGPLLSVQLAAGMNLPRIACVTLLNPTMTTPLAQFHSCMVVNRRTSNLLSTQLSRRDDSACLALPCLNEILCSSEQTEPCYESSPSVISYLHELHHVH